VADTGRGSIGRTILVIEEQPYLWAALRERVDPALAYVRSAEPGELDGVWRTCLPWPWLVVGTSDLMPPGLGELLDSHPIPVHWVGPVPPGVPGRPVGHRDWTGLMGALEGLRALGEAGPGGVRLMRNRGLVTADGRIVLDVVNVEGLLAAPDGLVLPANGAAGPAAGALQAEIDVNALPLRLERIGDLLRLTEPLEEVSG